MNKHTHFIHLEYHPPTILGVSALIYTLLSAFIQSAQYSRVVVYMRINPFTHIHRHTHVISRIHINIYTNFTLCWGLFHRVNRVGGCSKENGMIMWSIEMGREWKILYWIERLKTREAFSFYFHFHFITPQRIRTTCWWWW